MKNPIEYTLFIQRISALIVGVSLLLLASCVFFLDPTSSLWVIAVFLMIFFTLITACLNLLAFWWFFFIRKEIITIVQVNRILGQSAISSVVVITALVLQQTQQLNILSGVILCGMYLFYQFWAISE